MRSNRPGIVLQDAPKLLTPSDGVSPVCLFLSLFNTEHLLIDLTKLQESENKKLIRRPKWITSEIWKNLFPYVALP